MTYKESNLQPGPLGPASDGQKRGTITSFPELRSIYNRGSVLAGVGMLADAYDLFVINIVLALMSTAYPQSAGDKSAVASAALWGAVAGQLSFGALADLFGRRVMFIVTGCLITFSAFASAAVQPTESGLGIYGQLALFRFFLGLGVGGEYPLSASITSETVNPQIKAKALCGTFSNQGVGNLLSTVVVLICLSAGASYEFTWRFALGFGALPVAIALYFRYKMHETEEFDAAKKAENTTSDASKAGHARQIGSAMALYWRCGWPPARA